MIPLEVTYVVRLSGGLIISNKYFDILLLKLSTGI